MLPKKNRLKVWSFFKNPNKIQRISSPSVLLLSKNSNFPLPRFAISVPKTLEKRSTLRHQTKRIIIEAIRPYLQIKIKKDFFLKAKAIFQKKEKEKIEKEIKKVFTVFLKDVSKNHSQNN